MFKIVPTLKKCANRCIPVASLFLLTSLNAHGQAWTVVGAPGVSAGSVSDISMVAVGKADIDTIYVAYKDGSASASSGLTVQMYTTSGGWGTLGGPGSVGHNIRSTSMVLNAGLPTVGFAWGDHAYKANIQTYNGSGWGAMTGGTDCSFDAINNVVIANLGPTFYLGYSDSNTNQFCVKNYLGSAFGTCAYASAGAASYNSLAIYNSSTPMTLCIDAGASNLPTAMYFNGSSWTAIGSSLSSSQCAYTKIATNGSVTYAVFSDNGTGKQDVAYKFTGTPSSSTTWLNVGPVAGFTTDEADYNSLAIEPATSNPVVAFKRATNGKANVMHFDGTNWVSVGAADFSAAGADYTTLALNRGGDYFVAFADAANGGKLTVMKFNNPLSVPTVEPITSSLHVYPNPNNGSFTVKSDIKGVYSITNLIGQTIQTIELNGTNNNTVTVSNLNNGVYFIKGTDGVNQKVVVAK